MLTILKLELSSPPTGCRESWTPWPRPLFFANWEFGRPRMRQHRLLITNARLSASTRLRLRKRSFFKRLAFCRSRVRFLSAKHVPRASRVPPNGIRMRSQAAEQSRMTTTEKRALSERDICTKFITPSLVAAGWNIETQLREEVGFTDGRIYVRGKLHARGAQKRADYILYF